MRQRMVELTTLSKYPFLNASKDYIKKNGPSVEELLDDPLYERARLTGVDRLDNALEKSDIGDRKIVTESDCIIELLSYPISRMITVCIDDLYFRRRYALAEARHVYKNLINEKPTFLVNIAEEFKINVEHNLDLNKIKIFFVDYLQNAPTRYKEWKMINRAMNNGFIDISHKDLARIIQESLRNRINFELDSKNCTKKVYDIFSSDIKRIKNLVLTNRKNYSEMPIGKLDVKILPPCMKNLLSSIQAGENVPHMGRFALVAFLNSLKLSTNDILKLFSTAPDFEEDKSRYQVEHITGTLSSTSYKPPGCEKMRTYGICPTNEIDEICNRKRHPLSYYKTKWSEGKGKK
jgi:DNA primase large subunit